MRIQRIQIRRYRAFNQRVDVPLADLTVLTGPNNLGKSTVLSALQLFFSAFEPRMSIRLRNQRYVFEDDYPKSYEGRSGRRWPTQISVQMLLDDDDVHSLTAEMGAPAPSLLDATVEFRLSETTGAFRPSTEFAGIAEQQHAAVLAWLRSNISYVYIPAARNAQDFRRGVFSELTSGAISRVSRSKQRLQALEKLFEDVKTEIAQVENDLVEELRQYLPSVKALTFTLEELDLNRIVSVGEIEIDDGARTALQQKGVGSSRVDLQACKLEYSIVSPK